MPPINPTMLARRLPSLPHGPSMFTTNLKSESSKLLSRISCHFFDRSPTIPSKPTPETHQPHVRRTIQTNYISTISSLVDTDQQLSNDSNRPIPSDSPEPSRRSPYEDAQSDNYGLYALKHIRNAGRRPPRRVPPPVPPPPSSAAVHRRTALGSSRDIVHEQFLSIDGGRTSQTPIVEQPRMKKASEDPIRRVAKGKAPLPKKPLTRSVTIEAQRNIRSAMLLDTALLEPPDERVGALAQNNSELYRIAEMHLQQSSLEDSFIITRANVRQPRVTVDKADVVKQKMSRHTKRNRLVKQLSTADSVDIFRAANGHHEDAFKDFNDELNCEPIVCVERSSAESIANTFGTNNNFQPSTTQSAWLEMNFANRFAAAFAEAFSEEDGITDIPSPVAASPSPPPPPLPQSAQPVPTATNRHQCRLSNPLVFAVATSSAAHHTRHHQEERFSFTTATLSESTSTRDASNLITNSTQSANVAAHRHDDNIISRHEDAASNPTQLRSPGQPNQMKLPTKQQQQRHSESSRNSRENNNKYHHHRSNSVCDATTTSFLSTNTRRPSQHNEPEEPQPRTITISERRRMGDDASAESMMVRHHHAPNAMDQQFDGHTDFKDMDDGAVEVFDVAAAMSEPHERAVMRGTVTRRTVYVMNI